MRKNSLIVITGIILQIVTTNSTLKAQGVLSVSLKSDKIKVETILKEELAKTATVISNYTIRDISYHYNLISSCYANLNKLDSAAYYLELSKSYDTEWFCTFTSMNVYRTSPHTKDPRFSYFTDALDIDFLDTLLSDCQTNDSNNKKEVFKDSSFQVIAYNDQLYRKQIGTKNIESTDSLWINQNRLDSNNRSLLDSLYATKGISIFKDPIQSKLIWRVLHHSTDCEWNKEWIKLYFTAIQKNYIEFGFIAQTLKRFYDKNDGYCINQNKEYGNIITELKNKYPTLMKAFN